MEMTIDNSLELFEDNFTVIDTHGHYTEEEESQAIETAIDTMRKYQMFQVEYVKRLKADMVAMLTNIQLEIEELDSRAGYDGNGMPTFSTDYIRKKKVNELVQQKINAVKETPDGNK